MMTLRNLSLSRISDLLYSHRYLWLFLWIISIMSVFDITCASYCDWPAWLCVIYTPVVAAFKATVITLAAALLLKHRIGRPIAWILIFAYTLLSLVNLVSYAFYGFGITRKLILILAQTTPNEAAEFMPGLLLNILGCLRTPWPYISIAAISLLAWLTRRASQRMFCLITGTASVLGLVAAIVFSICFTSGRTAHLLSARTLKYGHEVMQWHRTYTELASKKPELPDAGSVSSLHLADNVIVVIGESASRSHHSLYGYPLPTTPFMESMADSLFVFTDVIASAGNTSGNMERILSFKKDDATCGDGLRYPLLIDVFNVAGYRTFWLSNQERTGSVSNTSGVMVMNASVIRYVGAENSEDALAVKYDEVLLKPFSEAVADSAAHKLIMLHLLGSHTEYSHRYPAEFDIFTADDETRSFPSLNLDGTMARRRAGYDNSIRYTDYILHEIIGKIRHSTESTVLIYFSDHGENVYDEGGVTGRGGRFVEVPFIIYANDAYRRNNAEIIERLRDAVSKPMSTASMVHLLLSVTGTGYSGYDPQSDILSDDYRIRPRYVDEEIWPYEHTNR